VIIENKKNGKTAAVLSVDTAEEYKVLIWTPLVKEWPVPKFWRLLARLLRGHNIIINKVRAVGPHGARRFEVFVDNQEQRDCARALLAKRQAKAAIRGHAVVGRSFVTRTAARATNPKPKKPPVASPGPQPNAAAPADGGLLRMGVWNAHSLRTKEVELIREARRLKVNVIGVCETNLRQKDRGIGGPEFTWYGRNAPDQQGEKRQLHGVGLLLAASMSRTAVRLSDPVYHDSLWVKVRKGALLQSELGPLVLSYDLYVGVAYLSPSLKAAQWRPALRELFDRAKEYSALGGMVVIVGDLNAQFSAETPPVRARTAPAGFLEPVCGPNAPSVAHPSTRGKTIAAMLRALGMVSLHGWRDGVDEATWSQGPGRPSAITDYLLVPRALQAGRSPLEVESELDLGSDHSLVHAGLRLLEPGWVATARASSVRCPPRVTRRVHPWSTKSLVSEAGRDNYAASMRAAFDHFDVDPNADVESVYAEFTSTLESAAKPVIGCRRADRRTRNTPRWWDKDVRQAVRTRRAAHAALRASVRRGDDDSTRAALWAAYREQAAQTRDLSWKKKRQTWRALQKEINEAEKSQPKRFWRLLRAVFFPGKRSERRLGPIVHPQTGRLVTDGPEYSAAWRCHFERLGNAPFSLHGREVPEPRLPALPVQPEDPALNAPISLAEVKKALQCLKPGKAGGPDGWKPEMLKAGGDALTQAIHKVFQHCWNREDVPSEAWGVNDVIALPKTGDLTDTGNYRGITLENVMPKLFGRVMQDRLSLFLETKGKLCPEQAGFRPGRECADNLFVLTEAMRECQGADVPYLVAFVDIKKAFDRVWRNGLWYKLKSLGAGGKFLRILQKLYARHTCRVSVNDDKSDPFDIGIGTKQGDTMSPTLFAVYINDLITAIKGTGGGVTLPKTDRRLCALLLADDLALFAKSPADMQRMLSSVTAWGRKWRLEFGVSKCGVLQPRASQTGALVDPATLPTFKLQGEVVPLVPVYKYLGLLLRHDVRWADTIKARVSATSKALDECREALTNGSFAVRTKLTVLRSVVIATGLFGSEFWCNGSESMQPVARLIHRGVRMITRAPKFACITSLLSELGVIPFHLQALQRRLRLLAKWSSPQGPEWPRWVLQRGTKGVGRARQSWLSRTISLAREAGWDAPQAKPLDGGTRSLSTVLRAAARAAAVREAVNRPTQEAYLQRYAGASAFVGQPYLVGSGGEALDQLGAIHMLRTRIGCLTLGKYAVRFADGASADCAHCQPGVGAVESAVHFSLECAAWAPERDAWMAQIANDVDGGTDLVSAFAALAGSPKDRLALVLGSDGASLDVTMLLADQAEAFGQSREKLQHLACAGLGAMTRARLRALDATRRTGAEGATHQGTAQRTRRGFT
jgi:hypothetical protein